MVVGPGGRIAFDYDMKIAEPFNRPEGSAPVDMWPALRALAGRPVLAIRGALSDILAAATLARMTRELPGMEAVTIPRVGHAPTLEEPAARQAIAALLASVA
jgi:pimeloyl-ACP methyl ester carboxylesterase